MSYEFDGNCKKTVENEQQVFDFYGSVKNFIQQEEMRPELAENDSGGCDGFMSNPRFPGLANCLRNRARAQ